MDLMRLLHVYSGNLYGGIETLLVSLAKHADVCPALEHEFALCFEGRLSRELEMAGAVVHRLGPARVSRPFSIRRARRSLASRLCVGSFDTVICHGPWSQALFGGVARPAGVPGSFWVHDAAVGRHWTERWAKRTQPDIAICNSHYTARTLSPLYAGVPVSVVYAPVDVSPARLTPLERSAVRAEFDTTADAVVIAQASRMQSWKGHEVAIEALEQLRERPDWVWWVIGGPQRPAERAYVESLVASVRRLGIAHRVRWVGQRDDVRRLLAACDLLCQPNLTPEPFGVVFIEALAAGLPVVTSDAGGAAEIVDRSCGVLVPAGDSAALAAALERLIVDPTFRADLAANAHERARRLSDPAAQLRTLMEALAPAGAGV
jgi:glycosyltransferase involved in cell wall biosynthesis